MYLRKIFQKFNSRHIFAEARSKALQQIARGMMILGVVTTLTGVALFVFTPARQKAKERARGVQQLKDDLRAGKIDLKLYKTGYEEATK